MKNVARRVVCSCCGVMVQRTRTEREYEDVMYASEAQELWAGDELEAHSHARAAG